jgi:hypothetical protein
MKVSPDRPLFVHVLEACAAAAGWDKGHWKVTLELEDCVLRRWGSEDPRNSPRELARHDDSLRDELVRVARDGLWG